MVVGVSAIVVVLAPSTAPYYSDAVRFAWTRDTGVGTSQVKIRKWGLPAADEAMVAGLAQRPLG